MKTYWEVIVQNIGRVLVGHNRTEAIRTFHQYIQISQGGVGRAAGEGVTLWKNGEIEAEYCPEGGEE